MLAQAPRPPAAAAAPPPAPPRGTVPGRPPSRPANSGPANSGAANFRAANSRPMNSRAGSRPPSRPVSSRPVSSNGRGRPAAPRKDAQHEILFQNYFKSVNPQRTYAAQVKKAGNGNHYVVFTEGRREDATGEVRKTRIFVYSEDFIAFFKMLQA